MRKDLYFLSVHDKIGKYLKVCDNIGLITGYDKGEVIGKSAYDFFDPDDIKNIVRSHISHVLTSVKYRIRKKNGKYVYVNTLSFKTVNDGIEEDDNIHCVTRKMNTFEILIFKVYNFFKSLNINPNQ
jgi:PAS domain S-box-containing protein